MLWGGIFCYTNAMENRKHRLFSVKCCVNARWWQWCCWQARKLYEQSTLSPEIWVIATLRSVSSPLAPTPPYSSNTFQKEVWSAFPGPHHLYPFKDAHKKWVSFLLLQMGIQALLISAFFFSFLLSETLLSWNVPQIFRFPTPRQWMVLDSGSSVISSYKAGEWVPRH